MAEATNPKERFIGILEGMKTAGASSEFPVIRVKKIATGEFNLFLMGESVGETKEGTPRVYKDWELWEVMESAIFTTSEHGQREEETDPDPNGSGDENPNPEDGIDELNEHLSS